MDWTTMIRKAISNDDRTLYRLSKDSGVTYQNLHRFVSGERTNINLVTAQRLAEAVGLELRPIRRWKGAK